MEMLSDIISTALGVALGLVMGLMLYDLVCIFIENYQNK